MFWCRTKYNRGYVDAFNGAPGTPQEGLCVALPPALEGLLVVLEPTLAGRFSTKGENRVTLRRPKKPLKPLPYPVDWERSGKIGGVPPIHPAGGRSTLDREKGPGR